jgi:hypothetical protein
MTSQNSRPRSKHCAVDVLLLTLHHAQPEAVRAHMARTQLWSSMIRSRMLIDTGVLMRDTPAHHKKNSSKPFYSWHKPCSTPASVHAALPKSHSVVVVKAEPACVPTTHGVQGDVPAAAATGPAMAFDVCCAVSCLSITSGMTACPILLSITTSSMVWR